jgi:RND family efflux transporter MFP subunit
VAHIFCRLLMLNPSSGRRRCVGSKSASDVCVFLVLFSLRDFMKRIAQPLTVLLIGFFTGCAQDAAPAVVPPPPEVTVALPIRKDVTEFVEFTGRVETPKSVEIRPRVSGYLTEIHFADGQEVAEGALLFQIDKRPYQNALDNALAQKTAAETRLKTTTDKFDRTEALFKKQAATQADLDIDQGAKLEAKAALDAADVAIKQAELDLSFTTINAPIAGRISKSSMTEGNLVTAAGPNPPLTTIVSMDPMYIYFDVDEATILRFRQLWRSREENVQFTRVRELNYPVFAGLASDTGFPHQGVLDFVDNRVSSSTGTLQVRAEFENSKRHFTPGFFVRVRVPFGEAQSTLLVPDRAIMADQSLKYVLVVNSENTVERRDVVTGSLAEGLRVVQSGLGADERLIINGVQRARPGMKVDPHEDVQSGNVTTPATSPAPSTSSETPEAKP